MRQKTKPSDKTEPAARMTLQRRNQIADLIHELGSARVADLSAKFDVSEVTIRSDLVQLEKEGQLVRDHGGAIAAPTTSRLTSLLAVEQRAHLNLEEKRRIGRGAAQLVSSGDTIIMDAGTTVVEMASHLAGIPSLTVVTNALNVALQVAAATDARVILLGGTFNRESSSILGATAETSLAELVVQKAFLGTQAIDLHHGLTDTTPEIAQMKRAMIRAARQVILLTDSSKWDKSGFVKVTPISELDMIVCDSALPAKHRAALKRAGIELRLE